MKKLLLISILSCFVSVLFAQTDTTLMKATNAKTYTINETSWSFIMPKLTMSGLTGPDTIIIGTDTILTNWPDTVIINFPFDFYDAYNGQASFKIEAITGETALTIGKVITYGAACATCEFIKISEDNAVPYDFTVPNFRLRLVIVATAGTGRIIPRITLKAS